LPSWYTLIVARAYEIASFDDPFSSQIATGKQLVATRQMSVDVFYLPNPGDALHIWFCKQDIINNSQTHVVVLEGAVEIRFSNRRETIRSGQSISIYSQENFQIVSVEPSKIFEIHNQVHNQIEEQYTEIIKSIKEHEKQELYTAGHNKRVGLYTVQILNFLDPETPHVDAHLAASYHDVGKVTLDPAILNKEGKLTDEEFAHIKTHPVATYEILLREMKNKTIAQWARWHHERLDGSGYPDGLKGDEIPLESRCMAVADVFDALTTARVYRGKLSFEEACGIMLKDVIAGKLDGDAFEALVCLIGSGTIKEGADDML